MNKLFAVPAHWTVPRLWDNETAFIVCGGPSVTPFQLDQLKGRKVIVVNSSYFAAPWADYLIFTDIRWWRLHHQRVRAIFQGEVVTITPLPKEHRRGIHFVLDRQRSGGLSPDPTRLACWHTTVTSAINLAVHLGVQTIVALGLDGKDAADGRMWHHAPHPPGWGVNPRRYEQHRIALEAAREALGPLGVEMYQTNPDSAHTAFPYRPLEELLG